ncbi:helix-turn-helix domain-containing protein [Paraburkholderia solisilvae]|uniref:HTH-type transcriptional activator RhaS n=1 Tax=Paraburkholderia solisilvae TaxID=624376 RepID=A0A6J5EZ71_9BURK|nr:helix-turn-helix domain-containing protein [Paraburkholderia solisilvae]CAB3770737.1 HTH-type transcriptional activator RhaS [Paraburkholderia solisilvae]
MILNRRRFTYRRSPSHQHEWHDSLHAFGVRADADPNLSFDSVIEAWGVGQIVFLGGDIRCLTVTPMSADESQWSSDYLFLKLVTSGSMLVDERGGVREFGPGGIVLLDPQRPYREIFPERMTGVSMRLPRRALTERGFRSTLNRAHCPDVSSPDVQSVRALIECVASQSYVPQVHVMQRLGDQLLDLMDIVLDVPPAAGRVRTAEAIVYKAKQYIERHAGDPDLRPASVAAEVCVSTKHLARLFSAQGVSLMRYVLSVRLDRAARLLTATPWHRNLVQQVAQQCGFSSASHFSHAFKQRYGIAPADVHRASEFSTPPKPSLAAQA